MNRFLLLTALILFSITASTAQKLPSFAGDDDYRTFVLSLNNELVIDLGECDPSKVEVKCKHKGVYITKLTDSLYNIRFTIDQEEVKVKLYYKNLPVDVLKGELQQTNSPTVIVNGKEGGEITHKELLATKKIKLKYADDVITSLKPQIYSYKVIFTPAQGNPIKLHQTKLQFNRNFTKRLEMMRGDYTVTFTQFMVRVTGGQLATLGANDTVFTVKR